MAPKRKVDVKKLFVSREHNPSKNICSNESSAKVGRRVICDDTHAFTSCALGESLHDPASMQYFSSTESSDEDPHNDRQADNFSVDIHVISGSRRSTKFRGPTRCKDIHLMPSDKIIPLERNKFGQFVGDSATQFASFLGTLARTTSLFPMTSQSWTHVSQYSKETSWSLVKQRFLVSEVDKKYVMQLLRDRFRDYKAHFKSKYYDPTSTPEIVIAKGGPADMPLNQFADIVGYWYSPKGKKTSEKNKACRGKQIGVHALGRTSLANRKKDLEIELGREPTRIELYLDSRTSRKKGKTLVDDEAVSKKDALEKAIEEQKLHHPSDTPISEIHEAAFRSTFGSEYYGRCRGMGIGVTAIQMFPDLSRHSKAACPSHTCPGQMREIDELKLQMSNMQKTLDCLMEVMLHKSSNDDCVEVSAESAIHISRDQFLKMMSSVRRSNRNDSISNNTSSSDPTTRLDPDNGGACSS